MRTTVALSFAGMALVVGLVLWMTAKDQAAQEKAEASMKVRLFNKYPDPTIAQMAAPTQLKQD